MKPYIHFLIFVIIAVAFYTVYGMFTFQVDQPEPFVFNEPKLPVELVLMDEAKTKPSDMKEKSLAVEEAQKALTFYEAQEKLAPEQAKDTMSALLARMINSDLPLYFLSGPDKESGKRRIFETLKIDFNSIVAVSGSPSMAKPVLNCNTKSPIAGIVIGTSGKDVIGCDVSRSTDVTAANSGQSFPDILLIGGPEADVITDVNGNRIINGGTGDDIITLGAGRSIILLDSSWGKDQLTVDCSGGFVKEAEIPRGFVIPWIYKTSNFIVLGNSIDPKDVEWKGNVLTHKITGDTLAVNQNCFTVVPSL